MKTEVLITGVLHDSAVQRLTAQKHLHVVYRPDVPRSELLALMAKAQVLISRSETDVDKTVIDAAPELKVIARAAVGIGNIDVEYATQRGILVINCPGQNTNSAAELTLGLLLAMLRNIPPAGMHVKAGGWDRHRFSGRELRGKRIGIVGLGNVGHRVAKFAHGFDMIVGGYDPYIAPEVFQRYDAIPYKTLKELAAHCDILSFHVPLNKETRNMMTREVLEAMPRGGYLLNVARGGIVDETLLVEMLDKQHLAGAAVDTFVSEPTPLPALVKHPAVWCTPHIGASTLEAQIAIGNTVVDQVLKAVEGLVVDYPVNLPAVGIIDNPLLKAYAVLAEKLGAMVGQMLEFNPTKVELNYRGDLAKLDSSLIRLSWTRGYTAQIVDAYVSFVNVNQHFSKLGIKVEERLDPSFESYKSALKVVVSGGKGEKLVIGGIVFDDRYLRVSLINDYYFEVEPSGTLLAIENHDRPGVIGDVGHFLAARGVNIDTFALSRNRKGGMAMALIRIDTEIAADDLSAMLAIPNIVSAKSIVL